jgi:AraC-like DNA-binding protein
MRIGIDAAEISGSLINVVNRIFKAATVKDIKGEMQLFLQFAINRVRALSDGGGVLDIAKAYIEQYYMMDLDLDKVASICGYSPSYFSRSFRKYFGINFVQYLQQVRLDNAKQLLKSSSMTVAEISEKTGFQSLSYFSTIFKRETGLSPNQYRIG